MRTYTPAIALAIVGLIAVTFATYMLPGLIKLAPRLDIGEAVAIYILHAGLIFGGLLCIERAARHADTVHRCNKQRSPRRCTR